MQRRLYLLIAFIFLSQCLRAQPVHFPKYYFRNPLGMPMQLVANFGELRPNHWHMGLDIRTMQKENLPVYAAAGGYIAHAGIRSQSFGRYIIINHPNGFSTLYAHLNTFFPALEQYITEQQYKQETWAIESDFPKGKFPVIKGQFIAYSGNTGGSQGPHLHFEIRNTKTGRCLNPLLFGLPFKDDVPPSLVKLAVYDRSRSVYEQTPLFFLLKNTNNGFIIPKPTVIKTGLNRLSFAIQAYDRATGSTNPNGIYSAKLFFDEEPQISFILDSLNYEESLYVNAQIDYQYRYDGGAFLQHLSQLPGDHGVVYHPVNGNGIISLQDTNVHRIRIEVKDAYLNTSQLNFVIQYSDSLVQSYPYEIPHEHFVPNNVNVLEKPDFEIYLPEGCLYDTIHPLYLRDNSFSLNAVTALHQVNNASIPIHDDITVRIKPTGTIPDEWRDKIIIQRNYRGGSSIRKAEWQNDASTNIQWLTARFGDFGIFQAFVDTVPPEINEPDSYRVGEGDTIDLSPAKQIVFQPKDNFGAIKNFRAELDSNWLMFTNDKGYLYIYNFDKRCPFGVHRLKITVEDLAGNAATKIWWFKRYPYTPPPKKKVIRKTSIKKPTVKKS